MGHTKLAFQIPLFQKPNAIYTYIEMSESIARNNCQLSDDKIWVHKGKQKKSNQNK